MSAIDPSTSLGDLVSAHPGAATLFERLGIDYCCGGRRTLAEACAQRGLDAATVGVLLETVPAGDGGPGLEEHDVSRATFTELCDHIVAAHHDRLRQDLPRIADLLDTVVRVHGKANPEVHDLRRLFGAMREDLEPHLRLEEASLFPACRALDAPDAAAALDDELVGMLEDQHEATGDALSALSEITGGYDTEHALCSTHRRLMESLHTLELDIHQHVHEENNVLFPRVLQRLGADH